MKNKYETNTHEINYDFKKILIDVNTDDIVIEPTNEDKSKLIFFEVKKRKHIFSIEEDTLKISSYKKKWYQIFNFQFKREKINLYLPKITYDSILIKCNTGNVDVSSVKCSGDFEIKINTGETNLEDISCKNFKSRGNTGNIKLSNLITSEIINVKVNTGNIVFDKCEALDFFIKTNTGNIKGTLPKNKIIVVNKNHKIEIPKDLSNGKCEISTNTGKISLE